MMRFLKENMSTITKMIVNQLGMMIFGLVLSMATSQNDTLFLLASVFSVCFYMFLVYTVGWELGAKDKVRLDGGRIAYAPFKGATYFSCRKFYKSDSRHSDSYRILFSRSLMPYFT